MVQVAGSVSVALTSNMRAFDRDMKRAKREAQAFNNTAQRGFNSTTASMARMNAVAKTTSGSFAALGGSLKLIASLAAGYGIYAGIRQFAEFEGTMNNVRAVSGATSSEFFVLNQRAAELGSTTKFTASQVAEAMSFMAMAGLQVGQIFDGVGATLNLAAAGNLDLGSSADIVTNIMTGMGLQVAELNRAVDVLTKTFTSTNTTLTDLGVAFKYAAPAAATAGLEFEEVAAAIGLMGNAGVQGSMAGTAMRGSLIRLLSPSNEAKKAMKRIGLEVFDTNGKMRSFVDIIRDLEPVMNQGAKGVKDLATIFGARPFQGISAVIRQGADALTVLRGKLRESGGTAEEIANIQMEGLRGAFIELKSAAEGLAVAIGESGLGKAFEELVDSATRGMRAMTQSVRELAPVSKQGLETLKGGLEGMHQELRRIDSDLEKARNRPSFLGDNSNMIAFLEQSKALLQGNIANAEEFVRLQLRLQETTRTKFVTGVEQVDPDSLPDEGLGGAETLEAKRAAALRSLQALESEYLRVTQQNRKLIQVESARELENFKKLLDEKLISQAQYEEAVLQLATVTHEKMKELREKEMEFVHDIGNAISSNLSSAFSTFIETGKLDFEELTRSMLADLAKIAFQMAVLRPLFGGGGVGGGGGIFASLFHSGGKVGSGAPKREVPPALFFGAPRLHNGGKILASDEVPAILQRGETVIGKGKGSEGTLVQVINNSGAETREESGGRSPDGREITRIIIGTVKQGMASGKFDEPLRGRFGNRVSTRKV